MGINLDNMIVKENGCLTDESLLRTLINVQQALTSDVDYATLAGAGGATLVGKSGGGTVQDVANDVASFEAVTAATIAISAATPGDLSVAYSVQSATYSKIGKRVWLEFRLVTSSFTYTTASGSLLLTGLPFSKANSEPQMVGELRFGGITKAGYSDFHLVTQNNSTILLAGCSGSGVAQSNAQITDLPSGGSVVLIGSICYVATS